MQTLGRMTETLHLALKVGVLGMIVLLSVSVLHSGISYQYDYDELSQMHILYLIGTGNIPYLAFHYFYVPLLHIIVLPLFSIFGYSFDTIALVRVVMAGLFCVRVLAMFVMLRRLTTILPALIGVLVYLLDPMTVFSSMQIRVDNLMMTLFMLGIAVLVHIDKDNLQRRIWVAGLLLGLSFLANVKMFPTMVILYVALTLWMIRKKRGDGVMGLYSSSAIPWLVFMALYVALGGLPQMLTQVFLDPQRFLATVDYPVYFGAMYRPDNVLLWGFDGVPLTWWYTQSLVWTGTAGAAMLLLQAAIKPDTSVRKVIRLALPLGIAGQWYILSTLKTAFIQYYMPLHLLYALCAVLGVTLVVTHLPRIGQIFALVIIMSYLSVTTAVSVTANDNRAAIDSQPVVDKIQARWKQIPENEYTFPDLLFRPMAYPLTNGFFVGVQAPFIVNQYPLPETYLEAKKVQFLLLDEFRLRYLSPSTREYIYTHYIRPEGDEELFIRKP